MSSLSISELAILIVEPSSFQQKVISQELQQAGCTKIETEGDMASAIAAMHRYAPDLVVSAMYLPDGDGVELVTRMRTDPQLEEVPFMLISSEDNVRYLEPIRQAGTVAILPKPFRHEDLIKALQATLHFVDPTEMDLGDYEPGDINVLVVDDSSLALNHITRALHSSGITNVSQACDGNDALRAMGEQEFDLIITDFNMPHMDGQELTRQIRENSNQSYVPILLITSEENETRLSGVKQAGVNAVCNKPFDPEHIKVIIKSLLCE